MTSKDSKPLQILHGVAWSVLVDVRMLAHMCAIALLAVVVGVGVQQQFGTGGLVVTLVLGIAIYTVFYWHFYVPFMQSRRRLLKIYGE